MPTEQQESVDAIDREVGISQPARRRISSTCRRIEAGALRAERDVFELDDLVGRTLDRLRPRLCG